MARATQSPKTGTYQLRKRVPADVRRLLGCSAEVKVTLRTKDPRRAAEEFRKLDAELEARWAEIRKGLQRLDHETVEALGGEVYRDLIARPGKYRGIWVHQSYAWFLFRCEKLDSLMETADTVDWWPHLEALHGANLDRVLQARGMTVIETTRQALLLAAHRAGRQAADVIVRQVGGDYTPDPGAQRFPALAAVKQSNVKAEFEAVWAAWVEESKPSPNTVKRWRPVLDGMIAFVNETNLGRIGEGTLREWLDSLLKRLGNNTIAKVHLAATKRLFGFAKEKKLIVLDPTTDLKVKSGKRYETKMRGYMDDEAALILSACLDSLSARMSADHRAARRWVPWLCAYTGARVNEMTQLRRCDIGTIGGSVFLTITPEAGTTKTGGRTVPVHRDLIDQGFMEFVAMKSAVEPLFYDASRRRSEGDGSMPPYEEMGTRLSKWVRRIGITDEHVDPNHAWRHRFKTLSRDAGVDEPVADAIQGHAPTSTGRRYGEVTPQAMVAAISKIPRFDPVEVLSRAGNRDS